MLIGLAACATPLRPTVTVGLATLTPEPGPPAGPTLASTAPRLCPSDGPDRSLVFQGVRYPIADDATVQALGLDAGALPPCAAGGETAPGAPLTRWLKGSEPPVYWLDQGRRHWIPDLETFHALGFSEAQIVTVPDALLAFWPLGEPLGRPTALPTPADPQPYQVVQVGAYTIRLWHPGPGEGLYDHATLSAAGQADLRVDNVQALGNLPTADVTGDGDPEIEFDTFAGGSHCCWGTVVYRLGAVPEKILDVVSVPGYTAATGRGQWQDLDADGRAEFLLQDPLTGIPCSGPAVPVILQYVPGRGYVGASPHFPAAYTDLLAAATQRAEQSRELTRTGYRCDVAEVVAAELYRGQPAQAWAALGQLYLGADAAEFQASLLTAVQAGRFYTAPEPSLTPTWPPGTAEVQWTGAVFDQARGPGAPLAKATVRYAVLFSYLAALQAGRPTTTTTDAQGQFALTLLVHDTDQIQLIVELAGYTPYTETVAGVQLLLGRTASIGLAPAPP